MLLYHTNIQNLILATMLENYQSAWMEQQWVHALKC